ncbi:hypothetical protein [Vibrio parahaemolyticus]|uniref:hypothetical protein n=1 Tax=Vibrio parahaemolyticus TaxID=670 RepID=UPI002360A698|nr:hypothetical protein [Vibrio parahaemolyticus]
MSKQMTNSFPLVEAIFELRWGERTPGNFSFSKQDADVYYQKLAMQAGSHGFSCIESPNSDAPPIPHLVKYRYRKEVNTWPCYQAGLGLFTVNQVLDGYDRNVFLSDIENGIQMWVESIGSNINEISDTLKVNLRYQNAFYTHRDVDALSRLQNILGVNITFPNNYNSKLGEFNSISMRVGISCDAPSKSNAYISINDALIEGHPGLLVETSVESRVSDILGEDPSDIRGCVEAWINSAYAFQKNNYQQLMCN